MVGHHSLPTQTTERHATECDLDRRTRIAHFLASRLVVRLFDPWFRHSFPVQIGHAKRRGSLFWRLSALQRQIASAVFGNKLGAPADKTRHVDCRQALTKFGPNRSVTKR